MWKEILDNSHYTIEPAKMQDIFKAIGIIWNTWHNVKIEFDHDVFCALYDTYIYRDRDDDNWLIHLIMGESGNGLTVAIKTENLSKKWAQEIVSDIEEALTGRTDCLEGMVDRTVIEITESQKNDFLQKNKLKAVTETLVGVLNEMLRLDPVSSKSLFELRVPASKELLAADFFEAVVNEKDEIGILGVLQAAASTDNKLIQAVYDDADNLVSFRSVERS